MKCYPQKIVSLLIALFSVHIIELVLLAIACDNTSILKCKNASSLMQENVRITRLVCDTIHAEEIQIFPLMDLDGNIIE